MNTDKSLVKQLDVVSTAQMSESNKAAMAVQAERADAISAVIDSAIMTVKNVLAKIKTNLNPHNLKHA